MDDASTIGQAFAARRDAARAQLIGAGKMPHTIGERRQLRERCIVLFARAIINACAKRMLYCRRHIFSPALSSLAAIIT